MMQNEPEVDGPVVVNVNDFEFGPANRMSEETFDDYKIRRKVEKLQLKVLNHKGRYNWPCVDLLVISGILKD